MKSVLFCSLVFRFCFTPRNPALLQFQNDRKLLRVSTGQVSSMECEKSFFCAFLTFPQSNLSDVKSACAVFIIHWNYFLFTSFVLIIPQQVINSIFNSLGAVKRELLQLRTAVYYYHYYNHHFTRKTEFEPRFLSSVFSSCQILSTYIENSSQIPSKWFGGKRDYGKSIYAETRAV